MARLSNENSLAAFAAAYEGGGPRLVVLGQGSFAGRVSTLIKVRPTLLERLGELAAGQQYLLVDVALQALIDHLEKRDPADVLVVKAANLAATDADHELVRQAKEKKRRLNRGSESSEPIGDR